MERPITTSSSMSSERLPVRNHEPKYKGVRKREWGKWVSEIRLPNSRERIWLGSYDTAEKAARAFDAALFCLRGSGANFNFSDNPPHIVGGQSLSRQEIQEVAARFANEEATASTTMRGESPSHMENYTSLSSHVENCTSSSSDGGAGQIDCDSIDWSFLGLLDSNEGASNFGRYHELDHMDGDYYPPPPPPPPLPDYNGDNHNEEEAYSHQAFLWHF